MAITTQDNTKLTYDEWVLLRNKSIGASEVGPIVYGSRYTSNVEIFYRKIGAGKNIIENLRMLIGKETEDFSAKLWCYFDGSKESIVSNVRNNKPVKMCEDVKLTYFNSKYPHLSSTPDRKILPFGIYKGRGFGSLEIKNTQSYVLKSYVNSLPTDNVIQICTQMMVQEWSYGDLFYFVDNKDCECYPLERKKNKAIEQMILDYTGPFWENVLKARPLYNQMYEAKAKYDMKAVAELEYMIQQLEPPPQNTDGYLNFLTEQYKERAAGVGRRAGTDAELYLAREHKKLAQQIDKIEKKQRSIEIEIKNAMKDITMLDFGVNGYISWKLTSNNARPFKNQVK